jgi:DNA-directed RNA polymerase subunit RPC12/RpoP
LTEYVCGCGHSFMKRDRALKRITHPLICTLLGHFVRFLGRRDGYTEYRCSVCGHTFCYRSN